MEKIYEMTEKDYPRPNADISLATDYDQRYLGIITKIFCKDIGEWEDRSTDTLNKHLDDGGQIAMYWHKGRIVGAMLWALDGDAWCITYIGLKSKYQNWGFDKELVEYMLWQINNQPDVPRVVRNLQLTNFKV